MIGFADLHIHSYFSDGSEAPQDIVSRAKQNGLRAIALTDHDTVEGLESAQAVGQDSGIEIIPGIEFSTEYVGRDVHILGYFFDTQHPDLIAKISDFQQARQERIVKMLENLRQDGVENITYEEVASLTRSGAVGRMHLALLLLKKGWVRNISQAFEKYLGEDCEAYEPKYRQSPLEAIELIRRAGGVAVYAHPMVTSRDEIIPQLVESGLGGIEVCYPNCPETLSEFYIKIARKHGLALTGGSDSHGSIRAHSYVGKVRIPYEWVEELRQRAGSHA